jgi:uncharacterized protein (TIGR03435 family)
VLSVQLDVRGILALVLWGSISLLSVPQARAQSPAGKPAFEVASLKVVSFVPGDYRANHGTAVHGEVTLTNATLCECLRFAFSINNDDQISGPDWIKSRQVRFNIVGRAQPETPAPELRRMLQTLLIERFKLTIHREQKERPFLALVAGKKGSKLQEARDGSPASGNRQIMGAIISNHLSMEQLVTLLSRFLHQPVLDMTGLQGNYEVKLEWAPENTLSPGADAGPATDPAARPSIFSAVRDQLGLALEARKGPLEIIVVDHADKVPIEN